MPLGHTIKLCCSRLTHAIDRDESSQNHPSQSLGELYEPNYLTRFHFPSTTAVEKPENWMHYTAVQHQYQVRMPLNPPE
jgi:hypothetical protein